TTRPAQISRSLCRGLKRMTSAPKRATSYRLAPVAISSIPQQAVANGMGHSEFLRDQLMPFFRKKAINPARRAVRTSAFVEVCGLTRYLSIHHSYVIVKTRRRQA